MRYHCLPGREDDPWETSRVLAEESPEKIAELLVMALKADVSSHPKRQHAYSAMQLKKIRSLLKLDAMDDECLHRHLDEFAIFVGLQVRFEPTSSPKDCIDNIQRTLINPLTVLSKNLECPGLRYEFLVRWGALRDVDLVKLEADIQWLLALSERQKEIHEERSAKGRQADSLIKDHHVEKADELAGYLRPDFVPTQRKAFMALVMLLAEPLFPQNTNFSAAVRKYVENWRREYDCQLNELSMPQE